MIMNQNDHKEQGVKDMSRDYPTIDTLRTGQNIKKVMKLKGLTVKDIQGFLQLASPQGIYHWFVGKSMPTLDNLYALSELFCVPVDLLLIGNRKYIFIPYGDNRCRRLYAYHMRLNYMADR